MEWIGEVEIAKSLDELQTLVSVAGKNTGCFVGSGPFSNA